MARRRRPAAGEARRGSNPDRGVRAFTFLLRVDPTVLAFTQRWADRKNLRWFGVKGVLKDQETGKTDDETGEERETSGSVIACVESSVFASWIPRERRDRMARFMTHRYPWRAS